MIAHPNHAKRSDLAHNHKSRPPVADCISLHVMLNRVNVRVCVMQEGDAEGL